MYRKIYGKSRAETTTNKVLSFKYIMHKKLKVSNDQEKASHSKNRGEKK